MKQQTKNFVFVLIILFISALIFAINYTADVYNVRKPELYNVYFEDTRDLINIKLKSSKEFEYDNFVLGTSITAELFRKHDRYNLPRFILFSMTTKEMYSVIRTFFDIHQETKTIILPLEIHNFVYDNDDLRVMPKYDYKHNFSLKEYIQIYFSADSSKKALQNIIENMKNIQLFQKKSDNPPEENNEKVEEDVPKEELTLYFNCKLFPKKYKYLPENKVKEDLEYIGKIIDFLKEKNIKVICFIPPANYIYLQDAMTPENIEIFNNIKKTVATKGVDIYDFSIKNKYTEEELKKSYMFFDLMHPNSLYGDAIYNIIMGKRDDKSLYRLITKDNVDLCNELSERELNEYRKNNKKLIAEYYKYNFIIDTNSPNHRKLTPVNSLPEEYKQYYVE